MRAFLVLTEVAPRIVVVRRGTATEHRLAENLSQTGVDRFIAHEVSVEKLRDIYGTGFEVIEAEVKGGKDLRVLDSNGENAFSRVNLSDVGPAFAYGL